MNRLSELWPARQSARATVLLGAALIAALAAAPRVRAQDVLHAVLAGGPTYPTGTLAHEETTTGYNILASATVRPLFAGTGLRLAATYDEFPGGGPTVGYLRFASATANIEAAFGHSFARPYAFLGGGYFYYQSSIRSGGSLVPGQALPATPPWGTRNASGLDGGLGLRIPFARFSVILEGRDNYVFFGSRQLNIVPVALGVAYTYLGP